MAALFLDFQFGCPVCLRLQKRVSLQVISCALLFCMSCVVLEFCDCEFTVSGSEYPGSVVYLRVGFLWCMIFDKDAEFLASDASKSSTWHFAVWPLPCPTPALQIKAVSCLVVGWPFPAATHLHSPVPALRDKGEKTAFPQYIERVFYGTDGTEEDAKMAKIIILSSFSNLKSVACDTSFSVKDMGSKTTHRY